MQAQLAALAKMRGDPARVLVGAGHASATDATVWLDTADARTIAWRLEGGDGTQSGHYDAPAGQSTVSMTALGCGLAPDTAYLLTFDGADPVRFRTDFAQDDPNARYAFSIGSCHQPFNGNGSVNEAGVAALRAFPSVADQAQVRRTLLLGDQMYTDQPLRLSMFSPSVIRALSQGAVDRLEDAAPDQLAQWFDERYRAFFNVPQWRAMMTAAPTYMILDDHEVWDNFGTGRSHRASARQPVLTAALESYDRFQRLGRPRTDEGPDFAFRYGRVAVLMLDSRSQRGHFDDGFRVYADAQKARMPAALEATADAPVLLVGVSVPFLPFPSLLIDVVGGLLGDGNNIQDRWSYRESRPDRRWLLETLVAHADRHPQQKIIIVSGDVHFGLASEFGRRGGGIPIRQFISSAISNRSSRGRTARHRGGAAGARRAHRGRGLHGDSPDSRPKRSSHKPFQRRQYGACRDRTPGRGHGGALFFVHGRARRRAAFPVSLRVFLTQRFENFGISASQPGRQRHSPLWAVIWTSLKGARFSKRRTA